MNELFNKAERFQNMLVDRATGGLLEDIDYKDYRYELITNPETKDLIPGFVWNNMSVSQFWQFIKKESDSYQGRREFIWKSFKPLLIKLETKDTSPYEAELNTKIQDINSESITDDWKKALERKHIDPEGAITSARTLVETTCKYILDRQNIDYDETTELPKLYKKAAAALNLAPEQHHEQIFKQILGGISSTVQGLGSLRNKLSDAHGKNKKIKPSARHSELAVNLAGSLCKFMIETLDKTNNEKKEFNP